MRGIIKSTFINKVTRMAECKVQNKKWNNNVFMLKITTKNKLKIHIQFFVGQRTGK